MGTIYKIINILNQKIYIGQTICSLNQRFKRHLQESKNYKYNSHLYSAILKYGEENFEISAIEIDVPSSQLNEREMFWVTFYQSQNPNIGYNIAEGGNKPPKNTYWKGKKQPSEMIEKRRQKQFGRESPMKGKQQSKDAKDKISRNNAKFWEGKHLSEETKQKLRNKNKGQDNSHLKVSYTLISPLGERIVFSSVADIKKITQLSVGVFYRLVRGDILSAKGWKLADRENQNDRREILGQPGLVQVDNGERDPSEIL